jgi:hypothetical protein
VAYWRHFEFVTNRADELTVIEAEHREHAVVEQVIADLKVFMAWRPPRADEIGDAQGPSAPVGRYTYAAAGATPRNRQSRRHFWALLLFPWVGERP